MKLNKLFASIAASAVAASALAASAGATIAFPAEHDAGLSGGTGSWLVQVFNVGSEEEGKPATDYGIDVEAIATIKVQFTTDDPDWFEGSFGGSVITSCNGGTMTDEEVAIHNWPSNEYWGVIDEELGIATQAADKKCLATKIGDYTYEIVCNLTEETKFLSTAGCVQIGVQEWGADMSQMVVLQVICEDASGNVLISFDGQGYATVGGGAAAPAPEASAPEASAPAAGDVDASTDSSKGSPDTGVEDVAVVAGLAIVAAGAVLVSKKRK
ncbi:MAG: LPXTG cell wall anchor domain-containing protein [Ruminiclostridium sp.]|nr:LPXTG cell wall anchor domain-containing protein [Ruminiclostridium sp.]